MDTLQRQARKARLEHDIALLTKLLATRVYGPVAILEHRAKLARFKAELARLALA